MGALLATEVVSEFSLIQRKHAAKFTFKNFHNKIKILPEHFLSSAASEEEDWREEMDLVMQADQSDSIELENIWN